MSDHPVIDAFFAEGPAGTDKETVMKKLLIVRDVNGNTLGSLDLDLGELVKAEAHVTSAGNVIVMVTVEEEP